MRKQKTGTSPGSWNKNFEALPAAPVHMSHVEGCMLHSTNARAEDCRETGTASPRATHTQKRLPQAPFGPEQAPELHRCRQGSRRREPQRAHWGPRALTDLASRETGKQPKSRCSWGLLSLISHYFRPFSRAHCRPVFTHTHTRTHTPPHTHTPLGRHGAGPTDN